MRFRKLLLLLVIFAFGSNFGIFAQTIPADIKALMKKNNCIVCHKANNKLVGPSFENIARRNYTKQEIIALVRKPNPSNWPQYPAMAPIKNVPKDEMDKIAAWIVSLSTTAQTNGK